MTDFLLKYINIDHIEGIFLYSMILLIIGWLLSKIFRFFLVRYLVSREKKDQFGVTSLKFAKNSIKFLFMIMACLVIIATVPFLRRQATLIFSGAGILAAIIGFAAQAAISNLIAGVFIVIFKPFRVGDYIKLDTERVGIVDDITLRHTVINTFENKRLIIPNSIISTESVLNHTIQDSKVLSFNNFKIGMYADVDLARKIIQEEAKELEYILDYNVGDHTKEAVQVRVIDIHEDYIHIRAYVWISEPFQEFRMKCKLKERVHKRFISEGVDMPVPLRKLIR